MNENTKKMDKLNAQIQKLNLEILEKNRIYYQNNKEVLKQKSIEYNMKNEKVIQEHRKEPVICICGDNVTRQHLKRHMMSKKHIKKMNI